MMKRALNARHAPTILLPFALLLGLTLASFHAFADPTEPTDPTSPTLSTDKAQAEPAPQTTKPENHAEDDDTIVINARVKQWVAFVVAVKPIDYTPLTVLPKSFKDKIVDSARDRALEGEETKSPDSEGEPEDAQ